MKIGSHVSNSGSKMLLGSVEESLENNANCLMVYLGAPQNTFRKSLSEQNGAAALDLAKLNKIDPADIIVHAPYIVNLANPDQSKRAYAIDLLTNELIMVNKLGFKYLVLHPGAHVGGGVNQGIEFITEGINEILANPDTGKTTILLETMAGKGTEIGRNFEEIARLISGVNQKTRIAVCLDTCHISDAGYDIKSNYEEVLAEFDQKIGLNWIKVIHLNDSKNLCGSHKDRHENIGFGMIGFTTLSKFAYDERFKNIPKILETPYVVKNKLESYAPYKDEIRMLKENKFNENLKEEIIANNCKIDY